MGYGSGTQDGTLFHDMFGCTFSTLHMCDCPPERSLDSGFTYDRFAVAGSSLLVLAAEEQPVPLLLELLCGGTLLRAAGHLLHRLRGARLALLPYRVPRFFGWLTDRLENALSLRLWTADREQRSSTQVSIYTVFSLQCSRKSDAAPIPSSKRLV